MVEEEVVVVKGKGEEVVVEKGPGCSSLPFFTKTETLKNTKIHFTRRRPKALASIPLGGHLSALLDENQQSSGFT